MTPLPLIHLTRGQAGCRLAVREGAVTLVVDALRASATLAALFARGAARVLVIAAVDDARALAARTPGALLVGERDGKRLPGFDLGNSPLEVLDAPALAEATVIFSSSNGAQRLAATRGASHAFVGTVSNAAAVAARARDAAVSAGRPVVLVAAGKYPEEAFISPEDDAACAYLAARIGLPLAERSHDEFARRQREIDERGLAAIFHGSAHARHLREIGYTEDIDFCARPDTFDVVPVVTCPLTLDRRRVGMEVRAL